MSVSSLSSFNAVSASGFDARVQSVAPLANGFSNVLVVQLRPLRQKRLLQLIDLCNLSLVDILPYHVRDTVVDNIQIR